MRRCHDKSKETDPYRNSWKLEKQMLSLSRFLDEEEELLPTGNQNEAKNYWAFVLPALVRHRAMSELLWEYGILMKKQPGDLR